MREFNLGLVGCGRISASHLEALKNAPGLCLKACCDKVGERADRASEVFGSNAYDDMEEMLKSEKLDLAVLCTPSGLHPHQARMASKFGVSVMSEKPLGTSLKDVDRAIRACCRAGVRYFEIKQNRLNPPIKFLRKALESGRFGRLHMIVSNVFWTRPQAYYDASPWRGTWEMDGGCLSNQASHYVDMVRWMGGAVSEVCALSSTLGRRIEAEDTISLALKFRNGAIGSVNVSVLTYPKNLEGSIAVMGEKGTVKVSGVAMNKMEIWDFESDDARDYEAMNSSYDPKSVYGGGHGAIYRSLQGVLSGKETCPGLVDAKEGRYTVEILEKAYERYKPK